LTHSLVGAALARTRPVRGLRFAPTTSILGASLPDIDVISALFGSDHSLGFRRGWTHGPLALLILPALLVAVLIALDRWRGPRPDLPALRPARLFGLAYLSCLTHPFLDLLNTYGVRLLMPFDPRWFYGDAVFIIDPWMWLMLGGAVYLGARPYRLDWNWLLLALTTTALVLLATDFVSTPVRLFWIAAVAALVALRRVAGIRRRPEALAVVGLSLATSYIAGMVIVSNAAEHRVHRHLVAQGQTIEEIMVGPLPANPFRWEFIAATPSDYHHGSLHWGRRPDIEVSPELIPRPRPSPLLDAVLGAPHIQGTVNWMRFPYIEVEATPTGYTVHLLDARYAHPRRRGFGTVAVHLDSAFRVVPPSDR
jgi:inner membrane protein